MRKQDKQALAAAVAVHALFLIGFALLYLVQSEEPEEPFVFEVVQLPSPPEETPPDETVEQAEPPPERPRPTLEVPDFSISEEIPIPVSQERDRRSVRPDPEPHPEPEPEPERPQRMSIEDFQREHGEPRPQRQQRPQRTERPEVERQVIRAPSPRIEEHTLERVEESSPRPHTESQRDELQRYFDRLHAAIYRQWLASSPNFPSGLETRIRFTVSESGRISDVEIVRSSGNEAFDRSVRQAMLALRPIGRVPTNETLRPTLPFRME
ncbi:MAG: TonB C-terminal domain-containing protein [Opitutales bacterium]|nr:TonB C-terminal domain-containing protein [Opitutales bacterium]MCH8540328.1 TonB C-terminal domain-containing protein [Opitutales bacterium]